MAMRLMAPVFWTGVLVLVKINARNEMNGDTLAPNYKFTLIDLLFTILVMFSLKGNVRVSLPMYLLLVI